jgi:hypothetical protein
MEWWETGHFGDSERLLNGFVSLHLSGSSIEEKFIDENGSVRWSAKMP